MTKNLIGYFIRITNLRDEPDASATHYIGKTGVIERTSLDYMGETQYWGTWGGIALYDGEFEVLGKVAMVD